MHQAHSCEQNNDTLVLVFSYVFVATGTFMCHPKVHIQTYVNIYV